MGSIFSKYKDVLIDISDNYSNDKCALYEINQCGKFLWEKIDSVNTKNDLVRLLIDAIIDNVDEEVVQNDVSEFLQTMLTIGFAEVEKNG